MGVWDSLWGGREKHLGNAQNLVWNVQRKEKWQGKGGFKLIDLKIPERKNRERIRESKCRLCKQLLTNTLAQPQVPSCLITTVCLVFTFNSISNYFSGQGSSVCICVYGCLSASNRSGTSSHAWGSACLWCQQWEEWGACMLCGSVCECGQQNVKINLLEKRFESQS